MPGTCGDQKRVSDPWGLELGLGIESRLSTEATSTLDQRTNFQLPPSAPLKLSWPPLPALPFCQARLRLGCRFFFSFFLNKLQRWLAHEAERAVFIALWWRPILREASKGCWNPRAAAACALSIFPSPRKCQGYREILKCFRRKIPFKLKVTYLLGYDLL